MSKQRKTLFLNEEDLVKLATLSQQTGLSASDVVVYLLRRSPPIETIRAEALSVLHDVES